MNKSIGTTLLVTGTTVGAGMLALPLTILLLGVFWGSIALIGLWALMAYAALNLLEANISAGGPFPVNTLARLYLGRWAEAVAAITALMLFWSLLAAYLTGTVSLLTSFAAEVSFPCSSLSLSIVTTLFLSIILLSKLEWVDGLNRCLLFIKAGAFLCMILLLWPAFELSNSSQISDFPIHFGLWALSIPILFTAFGFHGSIHTFVRYAEGNIPALRRAFVGGSLLPLGVYLVWIWATIGALESQNPQILSEFKNSSGNIGLFIAALGAMHSSSALGNCVWTFSILAIITSAFGVALGLFDMWIERLRPLVPSSIGLRGLSVILTLIVPLFTTLYYPNAFICALRFAAIFLSTIAIVIPSLVVIQIRRQKLGQGYRAPGGFLSLSLLLLAGIAIIALEISNLVLS